MIDIPLPKKLEAFKNKISRIEADRGISHEERDFLLSKYQGGGINDKFPDARKSIREYEASP